MHAVYIQNLDICTVILKGGGGGGGGMDMFGGMFPTQKGFQLIDIASHYTEVDTLCGSNVSSTRRKYVPSVHV